MKDASGPACGGTRGSGCPAGGAVDRATRQVATDGRVQDAGHPLTSRAGHCTQDGDARRLRLSYRAELEVDPHQTSERARRRSSSLYFRWVST